MFKYTNTIIYTLLSLFLFLLVVKYGTYVLNTNCIEGLTDFEKYSRQIIPYPKDAVIDYNNINSPEYSHTVNLPINDPVSCKNFCGPNAKCLLTGEQCSSDVDCYGCQPKQENRSECITKDVEPYDATGKLTQNQGLQYSPLTTGYNNHNIGFAKLDENSNDRTVTKGYQGPDLWSKSFNEGLRLYNKKRESADKYGYNLDFGFNTKTTQMEPKYPLQISATGEFYETTPPASNSIKY